MADNYIEVPLKGLQKIALSIYKDGSEKVRQIILIIEKNISLRKINNDKAKLTKKEYHFFKKEYEYVL